MGFGHAIDVGEGVALVTQAAGDQLGGRGHDLAREHLPFLGEQQCLQLFLRHLEVAAELDVAHGVTLAFGDVHGDVDVLLVRRDGYLGGGDIHVDIAAVQVVGAQALEVAGEFFAGILVVVAEERQPIGRLQLEQAHQVFVGEDTVADDVDVLDRRHRAFVDLDLQGDAVARLGNGLGLDGRRVAALGDVLALQFVAHAFEGGSLEDLAFGQPRLLQSGEQVFGLDRLVAVDLDARNRWSFHHADHQHVAFATELDVLEEAGPEQCAGRLDQARIVGCLPHVQRQCTEYATGGNPLQTVDADIGNREGLGVNLGDHQCGNHRR